MLVCLAGEADDEVGRDSDIGYGIAYSVHQAPVAIHCVTAAHGLQDLVVPVLHRNIDAATDLGQSGGGRDNAFTHVQRMRCQKAQTPQIRDVMQSGQQIGQVGPAAPVAGRRAMECSVSC